MQANSQRYFLVGERVEITMTTKGGFHTGRYLATVTGLPSNNRIKVRDDEGHEHIPFLSHVRRLD